MSLAVIQHKTQIVRQRVEEVVRGYTHAFFIWGPGGHGKTHQIASVLDELLGDAWQHINSDITAPALVRKLYEHHDKIFCIEDCEQLLHDQKAQGLIRSACAAARGKPRYISWGRVANEGDGAYHFYFTGGIIVASNDPLKSYGRLGALASRFAPMEWRLSDQELIATIRSIASNRGSISLANGSRESFTREEMSAVAEQVIVALNERSKTHGSHHGVSVRSYTEQALPTYANWRKHKGIDWREILVTKIQAAAIDAPLRVESRAETMQRHRQIAQECYQVGNNTKQRLALWNERTDGLGKQAFYDRHKEAKAEAKLITKTKTADVPESNNILADADAIEEMVRKMAK